MTVTIDGNNGVTTPVTTLVNVGTNVLLPAVTAGVFNQRTPSLSGTLLVSSVGMLLPTDVGFTGAVLTTNGAGVLSWTMPAFPLTVGITQIAAGTPGRLLYNNGNVLGEQVLGSGVPAALAVGVNTALGFAVLDSSGHLGVAQGGTGAGTAAAAMVNLLPTQSGQAGKFLQTDGAGNLSWGSTTIGLTVGSTPIASGTTNSLLYDNAGVVGEITMGAGVATALALDVNSASGFPILDGAGTLPVAQGGTGATTAAAAAANLLPTQSGQSGKFLTTDGAGNLSWLGGNLGSVTSVAFSAGSTGFGVSGSPVTTSGTITLTGTLSIGAGGTGQVTPNAAFNALAPSQTGAGGRFLQTDGTNTSWVAGGMGTVQSVNASGGGTGLLFTGGPITTLGTLTLDGLLNIGHGGTGLTSVGPAGTVPISTGSGLVYGTPSVLVTRTAPVVAATTADITLLGTQTIDTVPVAAGDRVLVKNQTLPQEDGVYLASAGAWTRATDLDQPGEFTSASVFVTGGTQANTTWIQTATIVTVGTTPQVWTKQSVIYVAGSGVDITGSTISNTGVLSFSGGLTGLTPNVATTGAISLSGTLAVASGGTGLNTLTAGYIPYGAGTSAFASSAELAFSAGQLSLGANAGSLGALKLYGSASGDVTVKVAAAAGTATNFQLPATNGTLGWLLQTDGAGNTSWVTPPATGLTINSTPISGGAANAILYGDGTKLQNDAAITVSNGMITLGTQQTVAGALVLANLAAGAFATTLQSSPSAAAAQTYTLPVNYPAVTGYALVATNAGVMSWAAGSALTSLVVNTTPISGGGVGQFLYDDGTKLQESAGFTWSVANTRATFGNTATYGWADAYTQRSAGAIQTLVTPSGGVPTVALTVSPDSTGINWAVINSAGRVVAYVLDAGQLVINGGVINNLTQVSVNYTIVPTDYIVEAIVAGITITLGTPTAGATYVIKNTVPGAVTLSGGGPTIDGQPTQTLLQWNAITVYGDGANWKII